MFNCNKCGCCCRNLGNVIRKFDDSDGGAQLEKELVASFPYDFKPDGACTKYDETIGCMVYETRPLMCRVDELYRVAYSSVIDYASYLNIQYRCCNQLMDLFEIDPQKKFDLNNI